MLVMAEQSSTLHHSDSEGVDGRHNHGPRWTSRRFARAIPTEGDAAVRSMIKRIFEPYLSRPTHPP